MPFSQEHSARLLDPSTPHVRVRRSKNGTVQNVKLPENISTIWFIDGNEHPQAQALRFPVKNWTEAGARKYLKDNKIKYQKFEPAVPQDSENLCYSAVNKSDNELDIRLHGDIGFEDENTSQNFYDLLTPNLKVINIDMNTRGGSVMDGLSIYNQLKDHPAQVNIKISGAAASMGSVIAMSADTITMPKTAIMMLHKPLVPVMIAANATKLRKSAEALDVMETSIIAAYETRLNKTESEIAEMLEEETWLNGETASELGLVDKVTSEPVNRDLIYHDFSAYKNVPAMAVAMSIDADDPISAEWFDKYCICNKCNYSEKHDAGVPCGECPECGEQMHVSNDMPKKGIAEILATIKKFIFDEIDKPLTKETEMEQVAIDKMTADLTAVSSENTTLKTENQTLKDKVSAYETEKETKATDARKAESKTFLDGIVAEGRIRPVDVDNHTENMELKFKGEDGEKKVNEYKEWLKSLPVVVDVSGKHIADKGTASTKSDDPLELLTQKIMAESKTDYVSALREAYSQHPEYLKTE